MARAELIKKLLAAYGRDEDFRAVVEQIIDEEEKKNNRVFAKSLRKTLDAKVSAMSRTTGPKSLAPLIPFPDAALDFVDRIDPTRRRGELLLTSANQKLMDGLAKEFRRADEIRSHGLSVRSKLLFCGPPGCGKTMSAEVFAAELGLPLFVVKLDRVISSYLGETASNVRKVFEFARRQPCVLFLDEFDALARARDDAGDHHELKRVVNSLLLFIDRIEPKGFLIAATNLDETLDKAIWRRFDEVIWFDKPDKNQIGRFVRLKFKNVRLGFDPTELVGEMKGYSYAEIERVCVHAIKSSIIDRRQEVSVNDFSQALAEAARRHARSGRMKRG
ncbi:MAG: ATP-binding protein [Hyphomonadaceae bacterium]|nr:ATP-binding protein [Hyphomonadaceae bacterium]